MKKLLLFILSLYIGISTSFGQLPTTCANMDPICSNSGLNFTAENSGVSAPSGNAYGCLSTQPNPTWYYLEVATSGPINMTLSAGSDVDYILYGPYSSLANAQSYCGNMGTAGSGSSTNSVVNCSYSTSATETPNIPNAIAGQVYVLLITNYANIVQAITLTQSNLNAPAPGLTDCSIVTPCSISSLNVTVGACNPLTNTFNLTGTVGVVNPPTTGTLIAVDCNGHQTTVASAPFSLSSYNFAINTIPSDGAPCNVHVYFSADAGCTQTLSYTNPAACNPSCFITSFSVADTAECNQIWKTDVTIGFTTPPTTGNLVVKDCQGHITVIQSAPFSSPVSATFSTTVGSPTPFNCDYTAYFTADPTCSSIVSFAPLPATPPSDEAGTFTQSMIGDGTHTYILCDGDEFDMSSNGDSSIPPIAPGNDPSVIYFAYSCPPSPGGPGIDPTNDPCFEGFISQASITLINNGGSADPFLTSLGTLTNNTFYLVPMTLGSLSGLTYQQNCYDLATEATQIVQYLNPITYTVASDCQAGTVTISNLQGGYPQFYGGNFTGSNLVPGTASFSPGTAALGGSIVVTGLNDGDVYSFDIKDGNGCPFTITGTFVGAQDPSFTYPNNSYCNTDADPSPTITGTPGGVFSVSPSGVTLNPSTGVIDLSSSTTGGVYTITYKTPGATCFGTQTFVVTIYPQPNVSGGPDKSICDGTAIVLAGSGASIYSWDHSVADNVSFTQALGSVTYNVTGTDIHGCINTDQVLVTVNPNPTPVISGADQYCIGFSTTLDAGSGYATYAWSTGASSQTIAATIANNPITVTVTTSQLCSATTSPFNVIENTIITTNASYQICQGASMVIHGVTETTSGVYSQTYPSTLGCDSISNITLTVNPLPNINGGADQAICSGTSVNLTATGGTSFTWNNGITQGAAFTPAVGTHTYTVTGTDANGCINTDAVDIVVNAIPVLNAGIDQTVCVGSQATLTASGATTYTWNNSVTNGVAFTPTLGSVTYTVSGTTSGCIATDQVVVTVNPLPTINAGSDVSACENQSIILTGFGAGVGGTYTWDKGASNGISFLPTATTYTITGTNIFGCINKDSLVVNIIPTPVVDFFGDKLLGCSPLSVSFTNNSSGNLTNCQWSFSNGINLTGCGSVSSTFTAVGCYDVTLTVNTPEGCTNTATLTDYVCVLPNPVADFYTDPTELSTIDWEATMVNTSVGATSYNWSFGDGSSATNEFEPKHPYPNEQSGTYLITLTVKNAGGCTDSTTRTITLTEDLIFYVPNTFTPDNDDFNEVFKPIFTSGFDPFNYTMYIFDRWGEILFESHNTDVGWDGTYGGKLIGDGTYIWKISVKRRDSDKYIERIGHVNILR